MQLDIAVTDKAADVLVSKAKPPVRYGHVASQSDVLFEEREIAATTSWTGSGVAAGKYAAAATGNADRETDVPLTLASESPSTEDRVAQACSSLLIQATLRAPLPASGTTSPL